MPIDKGQIEATRAAAVGFFGEVADGRGADPRPLPVSHSARVVTAASLHLHEDDLVRQIDHQVELALAASPAGCADPSTAETIVPGSEFLGSYSRVEITGGVHPWMLRGGRAGRNGRVGKWLTPDQCQRPGIDLAAWQSKSGGHFGRGIPHAALLERGGQRGV